jgi:aminopeptidase N
MLAYANVPERIFLNDQLAGFLFEKLQSATPGSSVQASLFNQLMAYRTPKERRNLLTAWLMGESKVVGLSLDQDRRWQILAALSRSDHPEALKWIALEAEADKSNRGQLLAKAAQINLPDTESKRHWFKELAVPNKFDVAAIQTLARGFHDVLQPSTTNFVENEYMDAVLNLTTSADLDRKIRAFAYSLYPVSYSKVFSRKARHFVANHESTLSLQVKRNILNQVEESAKIRKARRKRQAQLVE